jgi:hypothetical protein
MTNRITQADLESLVKEINFKTLGIESPTHGTPESFELQYAYGGVKLVQRGDSGGYRDVSCDGYGTKKQLYTFLRGMTY